MAPRCPDDRLAEEYMKAEPRKRAIMAARIAQLPAPIWTQLLMHVAVPVLILTTVWLNVELSTNLGVEPVILLVLDIVVGAKSLFIYTLYRALKPSAANLLSEYKKRHGHFPPE